MNFHNNNKNKQNVSPARMEATIVTVSNTVSETTTKQEYQLTEMLFYEAVYVQSLCML